MSWKVETKKGQRSPPPLPMYERVVLKHVPTMVRRRYDKDLNIVHKNNQGLPSEDGKNGVEDLDDSFDHDEAEDATNASLDIEHDSQFFEENFGGSIIESSTSMYSDDSKSKDDGTPDKFVDDLISWISSSKDCEDDGDIRAKDLVRYVDANVGNEVHEDDQDCKTKREGAEDGNVASYYMNVSIQGKIQDKEHENFDYKQERKDEDDGAKDVNVAYYVDTCVKNEVQDNEKGFHAEDNKSEGDGTEDGSVASNFKDGIFEDKFQDNQHGYYDNKQEKLTVIFGTNTAKGDHSPIPLPMYEPVLLKHVPTFVVRRYDKDIHKFDASPGFHVEDNKSKGDGTEDGKVAKNYQDGAVEDEVQHNQHVNFDNKQERLTVTCGKDATNGDQSPTPLPMYDSVLLKHVPTFVVRRYEKGIHKFDASPGLVSEESKSKEGVEHSSNASSVDASVEDRIQVHGHAKLDANDQERLTVTCGKDATNGDQSPTPLPMYDSVLLKHVPTFVVRRYEKDIHKFDASPGLVSEESKSKEGVEHSSNASSVDARVEDGIQVHGHAKLDANDQDLIPKDFSTTLDRDGYDICCPDCKHFITRTLIFRRREDCQQYQTTCFSFLTSMFCCNRW